MTVRVTKETQPRVVLKGANSGSVNSGVLSGSGDGVRVSMTFTATAEPLIVIPYGNVAEAQLEEGSFATSYIPTSGSQQTRSADVASIPVTAFGYNDQAGTVVVEFDMNAGSSVDDSVVFQIDDTTANERLNVMEQNNQSRLFMSSGGVTQDSISNESISEGVMHKVAVAVATDDNAMSTDGSTTEAGDGTSIMPVGVTTLRLGAVHNPNWQLNGHIKSLKYYPRRLTDAQLQELTA